MVLAAAASGQSPPRVVLSEIHYHPSDAQSDAAEFIELHNPGATDVALDGWRFTRGIDYVFAPGSHLPPGGFFVLVRDAAAYRTAFGSEAPIGDVFTGRLENDGETLRLRTAPPGDVTAAEVTYSPRAPWPAGASGAGKSLELRDETADGSDPYHWRSGGPTPGTTNSVAGSPPGIQLGHSRHAPGRPRSADSVVVRVAAFHARPLARIEVKYRLGIAPAAPTESLPLKDDGSAGDAVAGDGLHSGTLPPQANHTLVRYWFEAEDADGMTARLPDLLSPTQQFGYHVYDGDIETAVPLYFLFMEPAQFSQLLSDGSDRLRPAVFVHEGVVYDGIAIRQRGAFARSWPKKSFKLIFNRDHLFLGQKRINLNSGWRDPAFVRELVAHDLHRLAGALYSRVDIVRLQVNGAFHGVFLDVEQPTDEYLARQGLAGAVWYKADSPSNVSDERRFGTPAEYGPHYERETFPEEPYDDFHRFCTALQFSARGDANLANLTRELDVENFLNYLVANQYTSNWDGFNKNHYFGWDRARTGKWYMGPWDLDRTLGDHWGGSFSTFNLHIRLGEAENPGVTGWNRVFDRFYEHPALLDRYHERMRSFLLRDLDLDPYLAWIDALLARAEKDIIQDRGKWNGDPAGTTWKSAVLAMKKYLSDRKAFLLEAIPGEPPAKPAIVAPAPGSGVMASPVHLRASDFVPSPNGAGHHSTIWQLHLDRGSFNTPLIRVDSREELTSLAVEVLPGAVYHARVAYRDQNGKLSPFSDAISFTTGDLGFEPVPLDMGHAFNADVIMDPGDAANDAFERTSTFLIADGFDGTEAANPLAGGLPLDRVVDGYQLADYVGPNALQLKRGDAGRIEIPVPRRKYGALSFLVSGGNGDAQVEVELHYAEGAAGRALIICDDWEDDVDGTGNARLRPELRTVRNGMDAILEGVFTDANEFALFETSVLADRARELDKVTIVATQVPGADGTKYLSPTTRFHLFALRGLAAPAEDAFRRGDADGSTRINVTDALLVLRHLFAGGSAGWCPDAADADDSGRVDLTDALAILNYLFRDGPPPAAPGPGACGPDPSPDGLARCGGLPACQDKEE